MLSRKISVAIQRHPFEESLQYTLILSLLIRSMCPRRSADLENSRAEAIASGFQEHGVSTNEVQSPGARITSGVLFLCY